MNSEVIAMIDKCLTAGISFGDTLKLRRIAAALRRWYELECGVDGGCIQRDEKTGIPYWYNSKAAYLSANDPRCYTRIPDREKGALKRLEAIMAGYPEVSHRIQSDPRGPALYLRHDGREIAVY